MNLLSTGKLTVVPSGGTLQGEKKIVEGKIPLQHGGEHKGGGGRWVGKGKLLRVRIGGRGRRRRWRRGF